MQLKNETYTVEIFTKNDKQYFQISSTVSCGAQHEVRSPERIGNLLAEYIKADAAELAELKEQYKRQSEITEQKGVISISSISKNNLLSLRDDIDAVEKLIAKCTAAADMFEEALRYSDSRPTDMDIYPDMAKVISEYGYKAKATVKQLEKDFDKFRNGIMDKKEG